MSTPKDIRGGFGGTQIAPSILSADFAKLGSQVAEVMDAGARVIHVDVMDGQFVPPITIGPLIVSAIADQVHDAGGVLDCHLMVENPEAKVADFASAGADSITFHIEATPHSHRLLSAIADAGCVPGLAVNPGTPAEAAADVSSLAGILCCMTVNPGWGGQRFIPTSTEKIRRLAALEGAPAIEVDGGVDVKTASEVAEAGAGLLVAGSAIFAADDPASAYQAIAAAAGAS